MESGAGRRWAATAVPYLAPGTSRDARRNMSGTSLAVGRAMRRGWVIGLVAMLLSGACAGNGCSCFSGPRVQGCTFDLGDGGLDDCVGSGGACSAYGCVGAGHKDFSLRCPSAGESCCVLGSTCVENGGACQATGCLGEVQFGYCEGNGVCCNVALVDDGGDASRKPGSCDGLPCFPGCACEPAAVDGGAGGGVCVCDGGDAGADGGDAGADGGDGGLADADVDGADASSDAPDDGALDAAGDAPSSEPFGVITCRGGCICVSPSESACVCP
jgi:hypothetical protein